MGFSPAWPAWLLAAVLGCFALTSAVADSRADKQRELQQVRKRIEAVRAEIQRDTARRDRTQASLRDVELEAARTRESLAQLRAERRAGEQRLAELAEKQDARRRQLEGEQDTLAEQLRTAYMNGRQERLKLLLNQQDPAAIGRLMVYYDYFNQRRVANISQVRDHLTALSELAGQVSAENARLTQLARERETELARLDDARQKRAGLLASLDARLAERGGEVEQLQQQAQALTALIEDLERLLAEFPMESEKPLRSLKGELAWPVRGQLLRDFGQPRSDGRVRSNGVLLGAERGTPVLAIAHGRVAYSDWLPGLGLLVVLDHGDGYMSLYGHNDTLTHEPGDWVNPGETIATVGDSGGQARPALYFELRRNTRPFDPGPWFKRRAGR